MTKTNIYHQKGHAIHPNQQYGHDHGHDHQWSHEPRAHQVVKAVTAVTTGASLLVLSGLTLTTTIITLVLATPIFVLFSPVLVPTFIIISLLATGFLTSGGFGVSGVMVLAWLYRYVTGDQHRTGEGSVDRMTYNKMWLKGGVRDEHNAISGKGHHATGGVHLTTGARAGLYGQS